MARAHVSEKDFAAIGAAFSAYIIAHNKASVEFGEWPEVLGPELFKRAVEGGYFGAQGSIPGFPYGDIKAVGFQVVSGTYTDANDTDHRYYALLNNGVEIARKETNSLETPEPDKWAAELGYTD